jgi:hypothetical protein
VGGREEEEEEEEKKKKKKKKGGDGLHPDLCPTTTTTIPSPYILMP